MLLACLSLLMACPTPVSTTTPPHSTAPSSTPSAPAGTVPDIVGVMQLQSARVVAEALDDVLDATDGEGRLLQGARAGWSKDLGLDVTDVSLLDFAGLDTKRPLWVLRRQAHPQLPEERLFRLPTHDAGQLIGALAQRLAEAGVARSVDDGVVTFAGAPGVVAHLLAPSGKEVVIWLRPRDPAAAAALLRHAWRHPSPSALIDAVTAMPATDGDIARFAFSASTSWARKVQGLVASSSGIDIAGRWRRQGNEQSLQLLTGKVDEDTRSRLAPSAMPGVNWCVVDDEALLAVHLPVQVFDALVPDAPGVRDHKDRLKGMLHLALLGRDDWEPTASLLELSRFVVGAQPADAAAADALLASMREAGPTTTTTVNRHALHQVAQAQPGRALAMVAEPDAFALTLGAPQLLQKALAPEADCRPSPAGLLLDGHRLRRQRWHTHPSKLAQLLGQVALSVDRASVTVAPTSSSGLQVELKALWAPPAR